MSDEYCVLTYHGDYNVTARTKAVEYIVVHYTGSGTSAAPAALNNCVYFAGGDRKASAHYFIDDSSIYEYADPEEYCTWHCGGGSGPVYNNNSIGVEVCASAYQTEPFTDEEIERLAWLVQTLMAEFGVPAENVVRHYDVTGKECPYPYVKGDGDWDALHAYITGTAEDDGGDAAEDAATCASLDVDGLWGKETTKALQTYLGTTVDGIVSSQSASYRDDNPGLLASSWEWLDSGAKGSAMVKALQTELGGLTVDGLVGPKTITALQKRLGTTADGCIDKPSPCVKALQRALNAGAL